MTAEAAGAVPDDVIEEAAEMLWSYSLIATKERVNLTREEAVLFAAAFLAVPSVAEVFARDAKVRELIGNWRQGWTALKLVRAIAALYSEDGTR